MRATRKLIQLLVDNIGLRLEMIGRASGEEVIILRDHEKRNITIQIPPRKKACEST
jgi:hypothetical protein